MVWVFTIKCTNINSFPLWKWKTWISSSVVRDKIICCNDNLNSIIKKALNDKPNVNDTPSVSTDSTKIFFNLQYSADRAERMVKRCIKKLSKCLKKDKY